MNALTIMLLGIVQGLLEWLPVSSQGNLVLLLTWLGESPSIAIDYAIFLHAGTMLSALVYYRHDFKLMLCNGQLLKFTLIATALTAVIGGLLYFSVKTISELLGQGVIVLIGIALLFTGALQLRTRSKSKQKIEPSPLDSVITGLAQSLAVVPGISRSGITTSALLLRDFKAGTALKLSFIISVPAILIAEIGLGLMESPALSINGLWGLITAFITGLLTIKALTTIAQKVNFGKFCIIMGLITLIPAIMAFTI